MEYEYVGKGKGYVIKCNDRRIAPPDGKEFKTQEMAESYLNKRANDFPETVGDGYSIVGPKQPKNK
jgi:hypothetical protein